MHSMHASSRMPGALGRNMSQRVLEEAASALGGTVASVAREEGIRWFLFSLALPLIGLARERTKQLGGCAKLAIATLALGASLLLYSASPLHGGEHADDASSFASVSSHAPVARHGRRAHGAGGALTRMRERPVLSAAIVLLLLAALDLSNVGVAIDRADLFAGPLLSLGRSVARLAGRAAPLFRAAWRWIGKGVAALAAFRAATMR